MVETRVEGPISPVEPKADAPQGPSQERRWTIHGDGRATILRGGSKAGDVAFAVTPTGIPTVKLTEEPRANVSGSLTLAYHLDDRYGVAGARADFALPHDPSKPAPRSLAQPPQAALETPPTANGVGRRPHDRRSFGAPLGGRASCHDAERAERIGQERCERAGRGHAAAKAVPQPAGARPRRRAPRPDPRPGPCAKTRRGGARRPERRAGTLRYPSQRLSRPEAGADVARPCA